MQWENILRTTKPKNKNKSNKKKTIVALCKLCLCHIYRRIMHKQKREGEEETRNQWKKNQKENVSNQKRIKKKPGELCMLLYYVCV